MLKRYRPLLLALLLVFIFASRLPHLMQYEMDVDEVWTVWQTFGTPQQIVEWTPYDWPPLSYLIVGGWKELVGITPLALRMLAVLTFLIGAASLYTVTKRLFNHNTALIAMLAYAALGYSLYLSILLRGYIFLLALTPLVLWLTIRYFELPSLKRAIPLAICLIFMFYIHLTSILIFAMLGLFSLITYGRAIWRWWLPGIIAAVPALPEIVAKASLVVNRTAATQKIVSPPILDSLGNIFSDYAGTLAALWVILFIAASLLVLYRARQHKAGIAIWGIWILMPILMYFLNPVLGFFSPRHLSWVMVGIAVWIGWGIALLPRPIRVVSTLALIVVMFAPIPTRYTISDTPLIANFEWLSKHFQGGDVLLIDPNCNSATPEEWDYFGRVYFPDGIPIVHSVEGHRRIWYVSIDWLKDPATYAAVSTNRLAEEFVGPPRFLFRLYEAPPDMTGVAFANGMRLHGAEVLDSTLPVRHEGEPLRLRLWWTVDHAVNLDFSLGVYLLDGNGNVLVHDDSPSITDSEGNSAPRETSRWQPGEYYLDEQQITLPNPLPSNNYQVYLTVYQYWDNTRITAPGVVHNNLLPIQLISVKSW